MPPCNQEHVRRIFLEAIILSTKLGALEDIKRGRCQRNLLDLKVQGVWLRSPPLGKQPLWAEK